MVNYNSGRLTDVFAALADPTRRGILAALAEGSRPVSELAQPFAMSLPGFMKHLGVLEDAGLLERAKEGRVVNCTLSAAPMQEAAMWLARYERFWEARLDALARYLDQQEEQDPCQPPHSSSAHRSRSGASSKPPRKKSGGRGPNRKR